MKIYDRKGMLIIPEPPQKSSKKQEEILLVKNCFCSKGHSLIGNRVKFNNLSGILLKARWKNKEGFIGLSPIYGEKCRISLDIELTSNEILELLCPECNTPLPVFSTCSCGGKILVLFLDHKADFAHCIGICNRVDCHNAVVRQEGDLMSQSMANSSTKKSGLRTSFNQ